LRLNRDEVRRLHVRGLTAGEIGVKLGCTRSAVLKRLRFLGLATSVENQRRAQRASIARTMRRKGHVNAGKMLAAVKRVKALRQERHCYSQSQVEVVRVLREQGPTTVPTLAKRTGLRRPTVNWAIRRLFKDEIVKVAEMLIQEPKSLRVNVWTLDDPGASGHCESKWRRGDDL